MFNILAYVFPSICILELLAKESLSFMVSWKCFGTMLDFMQFKSAPVSNRATVLNRKSLSKTREILTMYFLEVIWLRAQRKSFGTFSIKAKDWGSRFLVSSLSLDSSASLATRNWIRSEFFYCLSLSCLTSDFMVLISDWRIWISPKGFLPFFFYWG